MRPHLFFLLLTAFSWLHAPAAQAQLAAKGRVVVTYLDSKLLRGNPGGENPRRRVSVYLPAGYDANASRYPVLYYLHGFTWSDSLLFHADGLGALLDQAIADGQIRPLIVVAPNENTLFQGSFYANSATNGPWADFTARELVQFIDQKFRTFARPASRGLAGHSMGGNGTLRLAMLYPNTYAAAYALSPAFAAPHVEWMAGRAGQAAASRATSRAALGQNFDAIRIVATARALSPTPGKGAFGAALPYSTGPDSLAHRDAVLAQWAAGTPLALLPGHLASLRQLRGLAFDWGEQDQFQHIPPSCRTLSTQLAAYGIPHSAEAYAGNHGNRIMGREGRMYQKLLPFFNRLLQFE
ncbi:alpha/beta hydrolase-fold protein [Hymenobacter sp. DH14]|uniref:Alpha/beta hydrolase-fold protein n=1 Tax=Hymenobacter cyanobacteriorum TaxID=2926463 RepID=A0A9X2AFX2_9BACT|nr:alpha/beta hydrolase-fold protein [Hymenobacter cyanobacteriorum]MCI1186983.1 alpha/beta hydrolase-fold protein [Hymenobacter cyanobacteriorum]